MSLEVFHQRPLNNQFGISYRLEKKLHAIGIISMRELVEIGAIAAYTRLLDAGDNVSIKALYAFEGAIIGEHWYSFSNEKKAELRARLAS